MTMKFIQNIDSSESETALPVVNWEWCDEPKPVENAEKEQALEPPQWSW